MDRSRVYKKCIVSLGQPHHRGRFGAAYLGDSIGLLKRLPDTSIDLAITSPPFALVTKKEYGNPAPAAYEGWFQPFAEEIHRVLRPRGSFVLEVGGSWNRGEPTRTAYNFRLLIQLMERFKLAQEVFWYNPAKLPSPAQWVNVDRSRLKDSVSPIWWLSKSSNPRASNTRVLVQYSKSMENLFKNGYNSGPRPSGHNVGKETFMKRQVGAIPSNLLVAGNNSSKDQYLRGCKANGIRPHPARFPKTIPEFFIKLTTRPGDIVLDPFAGSNVTGAVAEAEARRWLAFEIVDEYLKGARLRLE